ncbi:hypothetical protein GBA52_027017 [Prunus armeniaca]|nr:hypothetical protein GBA52_027017 [Prunus armeniaca]
MASDPGRPDSTVPLPPKSFELDRFAEVANKVADASGEVIRKFFRQKFDILDKKDSSPVTIADQTAEETMVSILLENFPSHAVYGEENGWKVQREGCRLCMGFRSNRWNEELYHWYTTSPHLFSAEAEEAFIRVRNKVKVPLYGCDCYAYALLASGYVDLVVESGLKPYDFLSLIPVIEGAGGVITDWKGHQLYWEASPNSHRMVRCFGLSFGIFKVHTPRAKDDIRELGGLIIGENRNAKGGELNLLSLYDSRLQGYVCLLAFVHGPGFSCEIKEPEGALILPYVSSTINLLQQPKRKSLISDVIASVQRCFG